MINIKMHLYKNESVKLEISSIDLLVKYLQNSYNFYKTFKGFDIFLKALPENGNDYYTVDSNLFYLDHKSYCNLFLTFKSEQDILYYVEDTNLGRGEDVVKNIDQALNYLKNDQTLVYVIDEFKIDKNDWKHIYDTYAKKQKAN